MAEKEVNIVELQKATNSFLRQFRTIFTLAEAVEKAGSIHAEISNLHARHADAKKLHEAEEQRHFAVVRQLQEQAETLKAKEREEILQAKAKKDEVRIQVDGYTRRLDELKVEVEALEERKQEVEAALQGVMQSWKKPPALEKQG